jgi:hypothetical protein
MKAGSARHMKREMEQDWGRPDDNRWLATHAGTTILFGALREHDPGEQG